MTSCQWTPASTKSVLHHFTISTTLVGKYVSRDSSETLIHAFVSSWLDYCNSLLYGLPQVQIDKIQRVQNAAARLIFKKPKFCHITPVLSQLHWLPIKYRIEFKILLMTFKAIHGMAPNYICKLISWRKSTRYSLRSSRKVKFVVPSSKILPTLGGRAFCYAAPKLWNNLPSEISILDSLSKLNAMWKHIFLIKLLICSRVFVSFILLFIIYHVISFLNLSTLYLLVNFIHFWSFFLTYCKAYLIMCHGKLREIHFYHFHYH